MKENQVTFIEPNTAEWKKMWDELASNGINTGIEEPHTASNDGEMWQYMGTETQGHCFRHRCHPNTDAREYIYIPA